MDRSELNQRFGVLRDRFCAASDKWPNLESVLITWPEDLPPPSNLPPDLDTQGAVPDPRYLTPEQRIGYSGPVVFKALVVGGARLDTAGKRFRSGVAARISLRRSFGRLWGDPREHDDPDEAHACGERFKALATTGAEHLEHVGGALGLSGGTLMAREWTRWQLAVHETVSPITLDLEGGYRVERLPDVFLASAEAIDAWIERGMPPGKITVDIARGIIAVDSVEYGADAHWCTAVQALIDEGGRNLTGPQLSELHGCAGKKWSREFANLKEAIPPLADRILSDGRNGYRIVDF